MYLSDFTIIPNPEFLILIDLTGRSSLMKLMHSRFRLISLLLTCVFLLTAVICTVSALKQAGITLPSAQKLIPSSVSPSPEGSPAEEKPSPVPTDSATGGILPEETDIPSDSEYNIYGL